MPIVDFVPVKFCDGETSFSSQKYFSQAEISCQSKGILFDQRISLLRTSLQFYSALAFLEPQIYLVVEQFGVEIISPLSLRLVLIVRTYLD